ncbi:hypothetical protein [Kingella sp. (in: b-proteobacteria)]|nr:hypothetical protein [Kingella sp. (in: b-proteobacteria)]MDO4657850.1 hypothetical protein [Kingella sp. (in: b-proteobacteria)]
MIDGRVGFGLRRNARCLFSGCLLHPKGSLKIQMERRRLVAKWRLLIKL